MAGREQNVCPRIFISYRREDSGGHTGRIYDKLFSEFGKDHLFLDVAHISAGTDFVMALKDRINWCDVMLVVIGKSWLTAKNSEGLLRIHLADDFVCMEISLALQREIPVIPILVDNARMPSEAELSSQLSSFARLQAVTLSDAAFHSEFDHNLMPVLNRIGTDRAKREKEEAKKREEESLQLRAAGKEEAARPEEFEEGSNWASIG